jgi:tripartite ATP-independent transporter DctM subunit
MRTRVLNAVALCNEALVVAAIVIDLFVTFANSIARYGLNSGIHWAEDASMLTIAIIAFLGAPAYFRRAEGMSYSALLDITTGLRHDTLKASGLWIVLGVCGLSLYAFPSFFAGQMTQTMAVLNISRGAVSGWIGLGLLLMAVFAAEKLAALRPAGIGLGFLGVAGATALLLAFRHFYDAGSIDTDPLIPIGIAMTAAFLTGAPIAVILALGGAFYFIVTGDAPLVAIPAGYQSGIGSFVLLAVPFFMLAGALMEVSGLAGRMIDMVQHWVGHWAGGLLQAQVVAMYIFSGISGSKAADIATVGSVMKGPLRQRGYPPTESVAVLAAAAAMGEVIPPSLALLILGSITNLSVGSLFLAGMVPAACLALAMAVAIVIRSRDGRLPRGPRFDLGRAVRSIPPSFPALLMPVIVVGCIIGGVASPTESSSFATIYGLVVAGLVYRSMRWEALWTALRDAALTAGMVLFMVAASNVLSQAIVIDGLGRTLARSFGSLQSPMLFLFLSMAAMVVIGFVLEGFPAILISAPILLPVAEKMGVDPLQYGIILTMAVGIGVFMPPVGIGYYVACAIGDAPPNATMRPSMAYNVSLVLGLVVVILAPAITLAVPHFFGFR